MKVKANCNINLNGVWHRAGAEFDVSEAEALSLGSAVSIVAGAVSPAAEPDGYEQPRRGRKRKADDTEPLESE